MKTAESVPHIGVANHALSVALLAEASDGNAALLAAHDEVLVARGEACGLGGDEGSWRKNNGCI